MCGKAIIKQFNIVMKRYTKTINSKSEVKTRKEIVIRKDGRVTYNPTEEMLLADGWVEYIEPKPTEEEMQKAALLKAKQKKIKEVNSYDKSNEVNQFYIKGIPLWLDREERATLQRRFEVEQKNGITNSTLWKNGVEFPLVIAEAMVMLDALEMYAIQSFDCTQRHLAAINNLATIDAIKSYDYAQGYPEKLRF